MARRGEPSIAVFVYGAGKVGRALARALRRRGAKVILQAARKGTPRSMRGDVVILAVRDADLPSLAETMAKRGVVSRRAVVLHVAGAFDAAPLAPLRGYCAGIGQMHPMLSFASTRFSPDVAGGGVHVQGDRAAVDRARRIARLLQMKAWTIRRLDTTLYHAAAGLVANGGAALAAVGAEILTRAGVPARVAPKMLGPLLQSVAENVEVLGFPDALTGPVRRGDVQGVQRHLAVLQAKLPKAVSLYLASAEAQLPLARAIGDAATRSFDDMDRLIRRKARRV